MHVSTQKKITVPHSSPQPGLGTMDTTWNHDTSTIIAIDIFLASTSMRWLKNYSVATEGISDERTRI